MARARIALVHDIAGVAVLQAKILRGAGYDVDHMRLSEFGAAWRWPLKILAIPIRLAAYLPIVWRLRRTAYDVIHVHWASQGIVGILAGKPFVLQVHGSDLHVNLGIRGVRVWTHAMLDRARTILYVTPNLAAYLRGYEAKVHFLPNPVDVDDLDEHAPPQDVANVLIFTRLDEVKGPRVIFDAVEQLRGEFRFTGLDWGPQRAAYITRYRGDVDFVGRVPHAEIGAFLRRFDVVVGQMRQGILSLSEIEALGAGRPVVTGVDWSLYGADPPPVLEAASPEAIVDALRRLRDEAGLAVRLSREGPKWARRNHGFELHLRLLEAAYFGAPRGAPPGYEPGNVVCQTEPSTG